MARVRRHGEVTVTGVPVRRALVARGFRGRPSLWVIFPKILCGVLGVHGEPAKIQFIACRANERVLSYHVILWLASSRSALALVASARGGVLVTPRRLAMYRSVSSRETAVREDGEARVACPFATRPGSDAVRLPWMCRSRQRQWA